MHGLICKVSSRREYTCQHLCRLQIMIRWCAKPGSSMAEVVGKGWAHHALRPLSKKLDRLSVKTLE